MNSPKMSKVAVDNDHHILGIVGFLAQKSCIQPLISLEFYISQNAFPRRSFLFINLLSVVTRFCNSEYPATIAACNGNLFLHSSNACAISNQNTQFFTSEERFSHFTIITSPIDDLTMTWICCSTPYSEMINNTIDIV